MICVCECTLGGDEYWKCPLAALRLASVEAVRARIAVWLAAGRECVVRGMLAATTPAVFRNLFMSTARCFSRGSIAKIEEMALIGPKEEIWRETGRPLGLHGTVQDTPPAGVCKGSTGRAQEGNLVPVDEEDQRRGRRG
jgi:hypothetical protein